MNYVFGWRFDTSEYIKKFTEKETLSYIHEHPNKLKP